MRLIDPCVVSIGDRSGSLTVVGKPFSLQMNGKRPTPHVVCRCDLCGGYVVASVGNVRHGYAKSCGCVNAGRFTSSHATHGFARRGSHHPLYRVFRTMKTRCYVKHNPSYQWYGARGIGICQQWLDDPKAFVQWGLANGWRKGLHVDRINNDGNYEPSNCRFVSPAENNANRRYNCWSRGLLIRTDVPVAEVKRLRRLGLSINQISIDTGLSWHSVKRRLEVAE